MSKAYLNALYEEGTRQEIFECLCKRDAENDQLRADKRRLEEQLAKKRYLSLAGDNYYPSGWADNRGFYSSIEDAISAGGWSDWCEVVDTDTEEVIVELREGKKVNW